MTSLALIKKAYFLSSIKINVLPKKGKSKKNSLTYETARQIIQQAGDITTTKEYKAKFKALGLPSRPHIIYKDDWQGFRHFLGTKFPSYETARQIIQQAGDITTQKEYKAKYKALGLPSSPNIIYKDDWQGFRHFLALLKNSPNVNAESHF